MKFDGLGPWCCEDVKGMVAPEIGPKRFTTVEKQAPDHNYLLTLNFQTGGLHLVGTRKFMVSYLNIACI